MNDVFSMNKEVNSNDCNYVIFRAKKLNISLDESKLLAVEEINKLNALIEVQGNELKARGRRELEWLPGRGGDGVGQGIEREGSGEGESSDEIGRGNEGVSGRISIITSGEVTVVRGDD